MDDVFFFRHWYLIIDESGYEIPRCSGWIDYDWHDYAPGHHRDNCDGYGNLMLLKTDKRGFKKIEGNLYRN